MRRGLRMALALAFVGVLALVGWQVSRGLAEDQPSAAAATEPGIGRYQAVAPDLVLDTATGRLAGAGGQMLESPIEPGSEEIGRFSAAGYVTAVTRSVGLDVMNVPVARTDLVKGYVIVDTRTGAVVRSRVYESRPLQANDL